MRYQSEFAKELEHLSHLWQADMNVFETDLWEFIAVKLKEKYEIKEK